MFFTEAHLLVKMQAKPVLVPSLFCSDTSRSERRIPGPNDSHKIWKETLRNVVSTSNEDLRMIFQNTEEEENNASFVI